MPAKKSQSPWTARLAVSIALVLIGFSLSFFSVGHHYLGVAIAVLGLVSIALMSAQTKNKG